MPSDKPRIIPAAARQRAGALDQNRFSRGLRLAALFALTVASLASCIVPFDTGANAAAMALDEMDNLSYSLQMENAQLQVQIDSLSLRLRKTDSLLRWVANLTGNPIPEEIVWSTFPVLPTTPPDTGMATTTTRPPPDTATKPKPPPV